MSRELTQKDLAYNEIAKTWSEFICNYDTERRVEVLTTEFLQPSEISGKTVFEAGCGLGYFTKELYKNHPSRMVSIDIAQNLVSDLAKKLPNVDCKVADLLDLQPVLKDEVFDIVFSSEVVEHTPDEEKAVKALCSRVAPGGILVMSCPNRRWIWLLYLVNFLGLRKNYKGYENWPHPTDLLKWITDSGLQIQRKEGIHTVIWHVLPKSVLRWIDRKIRSFNYPFACNLAIKAKRPQ